MKPTRRLLLVSPVFHGYWRSIQRAFEALGYEVVTHCYDSCSKPETAWNKVRHELPAKLSGRQQHLSEERVSQRAIAVLQQVKPEIVLVVRGDVLTLDFWQQVRRQRAIPVLWLYDEIRRQRYDLENISELAAVATYSRADAAALQARGASALYVPLAFDPQAPITQFTDLAEINFIGARFDKRVEYLSAVAKAGISVKAYGRDWSNRLVDRLRTWRLTGSPVPAAPDLSLADAYGVMRAGMATLNIHGDQDGFTMRTFEACGVGAVQLIDRRDVTEFYEPERELIIFSGIEDLTERCRQLAADPGRLSELRQAARARTLGEHTFEHRAVAIQRLWA